MANNGESSPLDIHCVFVETNLETRLALLVHNDDTISDFKEKLCKEHTKCFPQVGDINISALKVKRRREFFHLPDSMNMICKAFKGIKRDWFMYVDVVRVDEGELPLAIMDVDQNCLKLDNKKKETLVDSARLTDEEVSKTEVKKTRKRKLESSDGKKSRKKASIEIDRSVVDMTSPGNVVDESKVHVGAVAFESCAISPREKPGDILMGAMGEDIESGDKNGVGMEESQQTSEADQEKILTVNSELVDWHTMGEVKDVEADKTLQEDLENDKAMRKSDGSDESHELSGNVQIEKVDDFSGAKEQGISRDDSNTSCEKPDGLFSVAVDKDNERADGNRSTPKASIDLHTTALVTYAENQLEANSNLTTDPATEKRKKRTKSVKDHLNQSAVAATTASIDAVNTDSISRRETLVEPTQKENEMDEKSVNDAGRDKTETDNERPDGSTLTPKASNKLQTPELVTCPENQLEASSHLTSGPATEKKRKRKKNLKDQTNQSAVAATPTSVDTMNGDSISRRETLENPLVEATQKEIEMGEKSINDAGRDTIETDNLTSHLTNQFGANSGLTTSQVTEKKKRRKNSSKDHIDQSSAVVTTTSKEIVNVINSVPKNVDRVDATPESPTISKRGNLGNPSVEARQKENAMDVDLESEKAIPSVAVNTQTNDVVIDQKNQLENSSGLTTGPATEKKRKQKKSSKDQSSESVLQTENEMTDKFVDSVGPTNNLQVAELANTPVQESKKLDDVGKLMDENVAKDKAETDAAEAKSAKSIKKKTSKKAKTSAREDTLVASVAQNVEPIIKVADGKEPDNVIRDVLDSLQQKNEAEENLEKTGKKKSSKKSKKKDSSSIVEAQVLPVEVNNGAQKKLPLINTDALFTPAKKDTGSHLKKSIEVADKTEDNKQILKENADLGDNFVSSQKNAVGGDGRKKKDQMTSGIKSKKEKINPGGSVDDSSSLMKPKERKGRVQPASSVTSHSQLKVKNDRNGSKIDRSNVSSKSAVVGNKKEAAKESSKSVTVNKSKMNFFKDAEWDSSEDESKKTASDVSTKSPSDSSSDDDSDVTSMSRKQGNIVPGGTNRVSGSLQDILRSSKSYKMAKLRASQSQPDSDDDSPSVDCVPDSQAN